MQSMASNTFNKSFSKPWQRSLDSQEFGFASNLVDSSDVSPADELFFKGQLLPLHMDHRLHLVQALSSSPSCSHEQMLNSSMPTARVGSSSLASHDSCPDDDVIEFNSCRLEREVSLEYLKESMQNNTSEEDHMLLNQMQCLQSSKESSSYITNDDKIQQFSSKIKGYSEPDCSAYTENRIADGNGEHGMLSWYEEEELESCNRGLGKLTKVIDVMTDPGSSSFRSQNSGFWDSGTDKDIMDSSSSRDSNGSSQDSYFHTNHTHIKAPSFINASHHHHHQPHRQPMTFSIPWKLALFKRGAFNKQAPQVSSLTFRKMGFSEDLGNYKASAALSLSEDKDALLPWKLDSEGNGHITENKGLKTHGRSHSFAANDGGSANVVKSCKSSDVGAKKLSGENGGSKSFRMLTRSVDVRATENEAAVAATAAKKQRSVAVRERWKMCARKLKPLCEMKRGWIGMDECGRRAHCEVEHGNILHSSSIRPSEADGLQMQAESGNALKTHKPTLIKQQKQGNGYPMAMSTCASSTISSPTRSGVLAVLDPNQKTAIASSKPSHSSKSSSSSKPLKHSRSTPIIADAVGACIIKNSIESSGNAALTGVTNNYRSISTMQELHSALQSAIAHCKDSNRKLNYADS